MRKRLRKVDNAGPAGFVLLALTLALAATANAQTSSTFPWSKQHPDKERPVPDRLPDKPTIPPAFRIPIEPLGFTSPGANYLGQRNSLASLDFLDENRLLFTFRVPGLIHREAGNHQWDYERQIRAVVLSLPEGTIAAEALWTVHDRARYLWMLNDGHFLFRDKDAIETGDATLDLKPYLHFPGPLLWLEMDPDQHYLVTNSLEPAQAEEKPGDVGSPATARAEISVDDQKPGVPDMVVRILRRDSGKVMLVSRTRTSVHLPINSDGYVESLRGTGEQWIVNLNLFTGGSTTLGRVNSTCAPSFDFVSQRQLLVTTCDGAGSRRLVSLDAQGHRLWEDLSSPEAVWPLLVMAPDGSSLVRETLAVNHAVDAYSPLDSDDIKGQLVRVLNARSGKVLLQTRATPALDAGGNVAISPSGRRIAVINAGAIEVFELPAEPSHDEEPKAAEPTAKAAH